MLLIFDVSPRPTGGSSSISNMRILTCLNIQTAYLLCIYSFLAALVDLVILHLCEHVSCSKQIVVFYVVLFFSERTAMLCWFPIQICIVCTCACDRGQWKQEIRGSFVFPSEQRQDCTVSRQEEAV